MCVFRVQNFHSSNIESSMKIPAIADLLRDICIVFVVMANRAIVFHEDTVLISLS